MDLFPLLSYATGDTASEAKVYLFFLFVVSIEVFYGRLLSLIISLVLVDSSHLTCAWVGSLYTLILVMARLNKPSKSTL